MPSSLDGLSSTYPSARLHLTQISERTHFPQDLPPAQQAWSWSTQRRLSLVFKVLQPSIAHTPPWSANLASKSSSVILYLLRKCLSKDLSRLDAYHLRCASRSLSGFSSRQRRLSSRLLLGFASCRSARSSFVQDLHRLALPSACDLLLWNSSRGFNSLHLPHFLSSLLFSLGLGANDR